MSYIPNRIVLLGTCAVAAFVPLVAAENTQVTITGANGTRLRVEAIDPSIVRLWLKPAGEFTRAKSLAMESAPSSRVPLIVSGSGDATRIRTDALSLSINRRTLAFEVRSTPGGQVLIPTTSINTSTDAPAWTLTQRLADSERIFGLGQNNHNNGRLDRHGVIRELWAGQQIQSGSVFPLEVALSAMKGKVSCAKSLKLSAMNL